MFVLEIENSNGERLKLTEDESIYQVMKVEGLTPPQAEITTVPVANMHGERFKSSRIEMRELVLEVKIGGEVEKNRIKLYNFFDTGNMCRVHYTNGSRSVGITAYCENFDGDLFSISQEVQISLLCPKPFWEGLEAIKADISQVIGGFVFPFAISSSGIEFTRFVRGRETNVINRGDRDCGIIISIKSNGDGVENPIIYDVATGNFFKVRQTMSAGDVITINTNIGEKSIKLTSNGVSSNIMGKVMRGSTWFDLKKGTNMFTYSADVGVDSLEITMEYRLLYSGV